jgi:Do/DeqQ family serine protease
MKKTIGYLGIAFVGALFALGLNHFMQPTDPVARINTSPFEITPVSTTYADGSNTGPLPDLTWAASRSVDAVVHVTTETTVQTMDPISQFFWGYQPAPRQQQGAGSGVILSTDGHIVTNNHVIAGADKIMVHTNDRRSYQAVVVGSDPSTDIALLKIEEEGLPFIELGNSDQVNIGEWVLAVGNPFNLTSTVTAGIVSAKGRNINLLRYDPEKGQFPLESFIQTDAAVNPGNSGGALVSVDGKLVGINTAIASKTGSYAGYSFAVPVNLVAKVTNDLMEFGSVQRAYIGVNIRTMDEEMANEVGMPDVRGVLINGLTENGAAIKAGLEIGDVILKVGEIEVNTVPALQEQIGKFRPGDDVQLTVFRDENVRTVNVELLDREGKLQMRKKAPRLTAKIFGAEIEQASESELAALNIGHGVKVTNIFGGRFSASGIKEGFIVTSIDKSPVRSTDDMRKILQSSEGGVLVEGVYPNGTKAYYGLGT